MTTSETSSLIPSSITMMFSRLSNQELMRTRRNRSVKLKKEGNKKKGRDSKKSRTRSLLRSGNRRMRRKLGRSSRICTSTSTSLRLLTIISIRTKTSSMMPTCVTFPNSNKTLLKEVETKDPVIARVVDQANRVAR